ncbi:uncharacterized protein PFLUO_LOCUS7785 [Penicillium psychrofluorescens]|uniref:uncharacterized protein n=1 Tax=Penicillium psychrofluorescens TaxID=3158075 RepID=UPI003CCD48CF
MATQSIPISPSAFAAALEELPLSALYAKVSELRNSMAHLHRSNAELRAFLAETQDPEEEKEELAGYVAENEVVVASMNVRIALLKTEVERRGQVWVETEVKEREDGDGDGGAEQQRLAGNGVVTNGDHAPEQDREGENGVHL